MADTGNLLQRLGDWLRHEWPHASDIRCAFFGAPKAGMSNETYLLDIHRDEGGVAITSRHVLRRGNGKVPVHPLQTTATVTSVELQYRVMQALAGSALPVAGVGRFEADSRWLGAPFFLMDFVEGETLPDFPSFIQQGIIKDAGPDERRLFLQRGMDTLATLHRFDWRANGLEWLDRGTGDGPRLPAQIALWENYVDRILATADFPLLRRTLAWLRENLPQEEPPATLTWGDARPQNILWASGFRVSSVMDWEAAAILPPEFDLAYWLVNDRIVHEIAGLGRLTGYPARDEQQAYYEQALGRKVRNLHYYKVFSALRIAATLFNVFTDLNEQTGEHTYDPVRNIYSAELGRLLTDSRT